MTASAPASTTQPVHARRLLAAPTLSLRVATAGLVMVFVVLATWYSVIVPTFEAPDETIHVEFITHLVRGHGLPILQEEGYGPAGQEAAQPPLYYAIGALVALAAPPPEHEPTPLLNWFHNVDRTKPGNKNILIHSTPESFPFAGTSRTVHVVRLVSVLMGAVTVALTVAIAAEIGLRASLAWFAGAVVALNPQFVFLSAVVNNDNAGIMCSALALYCGARMVRRGPTDRLLLALGIAAGCAMMSKLSGAVVGPLALVAWLLSNRAGRRWSRDLVLIIGPAAAIGGWWLLRNLALYGDPFGWTRMMSTVDAIVRRTMTLESMLFELHALHDSSFAVFGWRNVGVDPRVYWAFDVVLIAALVGLLIVVARSLRGQPAQGWWPSQRAAALLVLWIIVYAASLSRWMTLVEHTGQGRLLFPALPAIAVYVIVGLAHVIPRLPFGAPMAAVAFFGAVTLAAPALAIGPAYSVTAYLSSDASTPRTIHARYGSVAELVGHRFEPDTIRAGEDAWITLYWRALAPTTEDLAVRIRLLDKNFTPVVDEVSYPSMGAAPLLLWRSGDLIEDRRVLRWANATAPSGYYRAEVSVVAWNDREAALPVRDAGGASVGNVVTVGPLRLVGAEVWPPPTFTPVAVSLADGVSLSGVSTTIDSSRQWLSVSLAWVCESAQPERSVTIALADASGRVIAETTGQPNDGWTPTAQWRPGERIVDERDLALPPGLSPGEYRLLVGFDPSRLRDIAAVRAP